MKVPLVDLQSQYQKIAAELNEKVIQILKSGDFIMGEELRLFEEEFAKYCETRYAIGVGSGTEALHLSLLACDIKLGDEVITSANTFAATVAAIHWTGAKPVLVDINPQNYNIDLNLIEKAITPKTKAVIPVHLYGQPVDMDKLKEICKIHNLLIIEDACQAHGAKYKNHKVGSLGNIAAFSFYPGKNLGAAGEGGIITTSNKDLADKIIMLRNHGQKQKYYHEIKGFNSRLDNLQAAILRIKLKHLDGWNALRNKWASLYTELLSNTSLVTPKVENWAYHVFHIYGVLCEKRNDMINYLKEKEIGAGIHYPVPIHLLDAFKDLNYKEGDFPITEKFAKEVISLPIFPELNEDKINYIVNAIKDFEKR
jgi:dTDP-4-amino-4,6-dideoxygalactose transaminase